MTDAQVAGKVGKARTTVTSMLALNRLPQDIRTEAAALKVAKSVLIEIAQRKSEADQRTLLEEVKAGGTVRDLRDRKHAKAPPAVADRPQSNDVAKMLAAGRKFARKAAAISKDYFKENPSHYDEL